MVIGIGDTVTVTNTVGANAEDSDALGVMSFYAKQQATRSEELDAKMLLYAAAAVAQMIWYWKKVKDHVKDRDCAIGEYEEDNKGMLGFLWQIEHYRDTYDWDILNDKYAILGEIDFNEWKDSSCSTAMNYVGDLANDGESIDDMERMFAKTSHDGVPDGWGIHDGSLVLGLGAAYSGPVMNMARVEMFEEFKQHVIPIVQQAQMSMKGIYNISSIMKYYEQVIGIHEGLATMFLQGFNSAGALLGTALGQIANAASGSGSTMTFNSSSVSGSSSTVHPVGTIGGAP